MLKILWLKYYDKRSVMTMLYFYRKDHSKDPISLFFLESEVNTTKR